MDLRNALRQEHSRTQTDRIAAWACGNRRHFDELVGIMVGGDRNLAPQAAWAVSVAVEESPALVANHLENLLDHLRAPGLHPAVPRATFRLLQAVPIPGELESRVLSVALAALGGTAAVAVKVYAMTVLKRLAAAYPEIMTEVRALIEEQLPGASPGFRARARMEFGIGDTNESRWRHTL